MAAFAALGLNAAVPVIQNYDKIYDKSKDAVKKHLPGHHRDRRASSGHYVQDQYDQPMDNYNGPRRGSIDRQSYKPQRGYYYDQEPQSAYRDAYSPPRENVEEIQRDFPPPGRSYTQPVDRAEPGAADGYYRSYRTTTRDYRPRGQLFFRLIVFSAKLFQGGWREREESSDSEGSIPPRRPRAPRRTSSLDRGSSYAKTRYQPRTASTVTTRDGRADDDSKSKNSDEESDVLSSSEDERQAKKKRQRAMITAGLAAVATVHAASGLYASMEARDKRHEQVAKGTLSPEQAKKEMNKARLQDAAAIGIAALGIKGAYGKWQGAQATHSDFKEHKKARKERHQKRIERLERKSRRGSPDGRPGSGYGKDYQSDGGYGGPGRRIENGSARDGNRNTSLTSYQDGNPYGGYDGRR